MGRMRVEARPVVRGGEDPERLLRAFGAENHQRCLIGKRNAGRGSMYCTVRPRRHDEIVDWGLPPRCTAWCVR
jgi:hypothetical protein